MTNPYETPQTESYPDTEEHPWRKTTKALFLVLAACTAVAVGSTAIVDIQKKKEELEKGGNRKDRALKKIDDASSRILAVLAEQGITFAEGTDHIIRVENIRASNEELRAQLEPLLKELNEVLDEAA